jgi:hypothetical protein
VPSARESSATYYACKAKFGGLEVSDAKRPRALWEENARLKRLLRSCATTTVGLWLRLDESLGLRQGLKPASAVRFGLDGPRSAWGDQWQERWKQTAFPSVHHYGHARTLRFGVSEGVKCKKFR